MSNDFDVAQAEANLAVNPETAKQIDDFLKDPSTGVVYEGRHNADAVNSDANDDDEEDVDDDFEEEDDEDEDAEDEDEDADEDDAEYDRKSIENF